MPPTSSVFGFSSALALHWHSCSGLLFDEIGSLVQAQFLHPFLGIYGAAAVGGAAVARGSIVVIVETVIPNQLLSGRDVAHGKNPAAAFDFVHFAVGLARMIQIGAEAFSVNDGFAIIKTVQIGALALLIAK